MKWGLAAEAGQVCHCKSAAERDCPRPISPFAISTSVISTVAAGFGADGSLDLPPGHHGREPACDDGDTEHDNTRCFHTLTFPLRMRTFATGGARPA